ncbi:MAG: hypothetical protein ABIJ85_02165 [bacterium]
MYKVFPDEGSIPSVSTTSYVALAPSDGVAPFDGVAASDVVAPFDGAPGSFILKQRQTLLFYW